MKPFAYHHDYDRGEQEEAQYEEEPEEPLGIMPKITAIVFLVSLLNPSALFDKHAIDLTDMFLHFGKHPFVFLVKQVLYLLPVSISDIHRHLQLVWASFKRLSICSLILSTLPRMVVTESSSFLSAL